jgi:hypothetical protein
MNGACDGCGCGWLRRRGSRASPAPSPPSRLSTGDGFVAVAAQFEGADVPGVVETLGDRVNVTVSGIKTKGVDLGPTYADDFSYEAMMFGSASGFYGGGFGTLSGTAEAKPEEVESLDGGSPLANPHTSVVDGTIQVSFIETAVVTGPAPGTPVTLEVNFLLESSSAFGGGNLSFPHDARATFFAISGHDYTVPVPEPAELLLALTGAAALASHTRRSGRAS